MFKSIGEANFEPPIPKPFNQFRCHVKYVPPGSDVQNLVGIDSAVTNLHLREKNTFCVDYF